MQRRLSASPDVYEAATWIAAKGGISVDTALQRLQRAARTAGLGPGETARQILGSATVMQHRRRETSTGRIADAGTHDCRTVASDVPPWAGSAAITHLVPARGVAGLSGDDRGTVRRAPAHAPAFSFKRFRVVMRLMSSFC